MAFCLLGLAARGYRNGGAKVPGRDGREIPTEFPIAVAGPAGVVSITPHTP
jgi:hypothetical protein